MSLFKGNLSYVIENRLDIDGQIVSKDFIHNQVTRDAGIHHITLIFKKELEVSKNILKTLVDDLKSVKGWDKIIIVGLGQVKNQVYYYVVLWPAGNAFREKLGLKPKNFHITVGFKESDIHGVDKGLTTLIPSTVKPECIPLINDVMSVKLNRHSQTELIAILNLIHDVLHETLTLDELMMLFTVRSKLYYMTEQFQLSLDDCLSIHSMDPTNLKNMLRVGYLYAHTNKFYRALRFYKEALKHESIKKKADLGLQACYKKMTSKCINPRERHIVQLDDKDVRLSRNFSWVIPDKLAGISIPKREEEIDAFEFMNIGLVVSVLEEETLDKKWFEEKVIENIHYDVKNYHPPLLDDMLEIIKTMEETVKSGKAAVVHCGGGKGRAGTVLACYVLKNGLTGDVLVDHPVMSGKDAIKLIRDMRPGSIETDFQEVFIKRYSDHLWKNGT